MATPFNFSPPTLPHPNFSHTISVKLTPENYFLWNVQLVPYLRGHRLCKYVDGSYLSPKLEVEDFTPNLAYDIWLQHDQLVISTPLISSIFEPLIAEVIGCQTTRAMWLSLESTFTFVSQARLIPSYNLLL